MEKEIHAAEAEVGRLDTLIGGDGFYSQDYKVVQETLTQLEAAKARVDYLYSRWSELDALS